MSKAIQRAAVTAALAAAAFSAHAQQTSAPADRLQFILTSGLTFGGDTIATAQYTNGTNQDIKAGGLLELGGGLLWQSGELPVALQATLNYHVDDSSAQNGSMRFERLPFEFAAYYTGLPKWRFGAGVRIIQAPKYRSHIDNGPSETLDFENTTGALVEAGYAVGSHVWINLRYVKEKYHPSSYTYDGGSRIDVSGTSIKGDHAGINVVYAF